MEKLGSLVEGGDGMILPLGSSLIMQYDTVVTHTIIKAIQFSWKSNLPIIASK